MCETCDQNQDFDSEDRDTWCARCLASDWVRATEREVERLAELAGWSVDSRSGGFNTRSRYLTLSRPGPLDEDGDETLDELKVRISDHGSAYCSEDISLAMVPSGDDHTIEALSERLK